ncbi:MAG: hypothetical protein ACI80N_003491, partial [Gammaproteobacteria bacterium]
GLIRRTSAPGAPNPGSGGDSVALDHARAEGGGAWPVLRYTGATHGTPI